MSMRELTAAEKVDLMGVLETTAYIFPHMGYCQGMNYIAAVCYAYLRDAVSTLRVFLGLIHNHGLKGLFNSTVPEYHLRAFILTELVAEKFPELNKHFKKLQLNPNSFFCDWILTLFCGYFQYNNSELTLSILDNFLLDGWRAIYRVSLAIIRSLEQELLQTRDIASLLRLFDKFKYSADHHLLERAC